MMVESGTLTDMPLQSSHPELIYLDHAATSQKPQAVIDRINRWYTSENASPNRGAYTLSAEATAIYESARAQVSNFIGAGEEDAVVFTKNATEALNLVAACFPFSEGDEIVVSIAAHHSVIVPLQLAAKRVGAKLNYLYTDGTSGRFSEASLSVIGPRTRLVALPLIDNAIGVVYETAPVVARAKHYGAAVLVDAAQAVGHRPIDFKAIGADFMAFSGHKMYGPQGIGVLVGTREQLASMPPFLTGGDMIEFVEEQMTTFAEVPRRFEAGTQNVSGAAGLAAAIEWIESVGSDAVAAHETKITEYAVKRLSEIPYVTVLGPEPGADRGALVSFEVEGIHPHDMATLLDRKGIAIRAGHHCCQPYMKRLGKTGTCRASFSVFTRESDIDALISGIHYAREVFGYGK